MKARSSLHTLKHSDPVGPPVTRVWYDLTELDPENELYVATPGGRPTVFTTDLRSYPWAGLVNLGANEWTVDFYPTEADAAADTNAQAGGRMYVHADGSYNAIP